MFEDDYDCECGHGKNNHVFEDGKSFCGKGRCHCHEFKVALIFAREPYSDSLIKEMLPLWQIHHDEIPGYKDIPLDPDLLMYEQVDRAGLLRIFTVRVETSGKLIGYQVLFVMRHPHSRNSLQATQDIIFLSKEFRKGLNGYKFLKYCSDKLIEDGVQAIFQHISAAHDFGPVLKRMGYELCDLVYARRIFPCPSPLP